MSIDSKFSLDSELKKFVESEEERRRVERQVAHSDAFRKHVEEAHGGQSPGLIVLSAGGHEEHGLESVANKAKDEFEDLEWKRKESKKAVEESDDSDWKKKEEKTEFKGYQSGKGAEFAGYLSSKQKSSGSAHGGSYLGGSSDAMHSADCGCGKASFELDFNGNVKEKSQVEVPGFEKSGGYGGATGDSSPSYNTGAGSGKASYGSFSGDNSKIYK